MDARPPAIPGFDVLQHIGSGGLGDVWLATRISTGGHVAIKVLRPSDTEHDVDRRIRRELAALLVLKGHPAVVHVEEVLRTDVGPALVMEYASDGSLLKQIQDQGALCTADVCDVGVQVARLLADAHRLGIIHRDIKPHNILRTVFGSYKVCDFGIAAVLTSDEWANPTSALSARYASPEEIDGAPVSAASDIFSLGVTLMQARTGQPSGVRTVETTLGTEEADRLLQRLLSSMLSHAPDRRPQASQVCDELRDIVRVANPNMADSTGGVAITPPTAWFEADTGGSGPRWPAPNSPKGRAIRGLPNPHEGDNWWN